MAGSLTDTSSISPIHARRPARASLWFGLAMLASISLALGDLAEVLPPLRPLAASSLFRYFHDGHDVAALILCLYTAHRLSARAGAAVMLCFVGLHIPYAAIVWPSDLPEIFRLTLTAGAALFGVQIISERRLLEQALAEQAARDSLTGLLNHRHFHETLEHHLTLAERYPERGALIFLDLDGFKQINDQLGHQAGDELLRAVARALQAQLRSTDSVARMGGDEFAALLPHVSTHQAQIAAERCRRAIAQIAARDRLAISASMGMVAYPDHGRSASELIARADQAMYLAKAAGRDQLVIAPPEG